MKVKKADLESVIGLMDDCAIHTESQCLYEEKHYQKVLKELFAPWTEEYRRAFWKRLAKKVTDEGTEDCNRLVWVGHALGVADAEYSKQITDGFIAELFEIASSGEGALPMEESKFHRDEFRKLFKHWTYAYKLYFWAQFCEEYIDGWSVQDLKFIARQLGSKIIYLKVK